MANNFDAGQMVNLVSGVAGMMAGKGGKGDSDDSKASDSGIAKMGNLVAGVAGMMSGKKDGKDGKGADSGVAQMANLVAGKGGVIELIAGIFKKPTKRVGLQDDESFKDNVKLIKEYCGDDVKITKEMPPIHESTALSIGDNELLKKIDAEMKLAMLEAVKEVKKVQAENDGYVSWKRLQQIFDGNEMYFPVVEEDKQRYDSLLKNEVFCKFDGETNKKSMEEAEKLMRKVVNDQHIWDSLKINRETIKSVFGSEGIWVKKFKDLFVRNKKSAHIAIDIGVVRFPRPEDPFFKLYRLRVIVFKSEIAITFINKKGSGIFVDFRERTYKMASAWNAKFTEEVKEKVSAKFDDAFSALLGDL